MVLVARLPGMPPKVPPIGRTENWKMVPAAGVTGRGAVLGKDTL